MIPNTFHKSGQTIQMPIKIFLDISALCWWHDQYNFSQIPINIANSSLKKE